MDGSLNVSDAFAGLERGGRRRSLQFVERPQRIETWPGRSVVVGIDRVATEWLVLELPHGVDVASVFLRHVVSHQRQHAVVRVVTSRDSFGTRRADSDLAASGSIAFEKHCGIGDLNVIRRHFPEVGVVDHGAQFHFFSFLERNDHGGARRRFIHPQQPDREHAAFFGPRLFALVSNEVVGFIGHVSNPAGHMSPENIRKGIVAQQPNRSFDAH